MRKKTYLLLPVVWFTAFHTFAQDTSGDSPYSLTQKKYTFATQPMQLFNWGLRFDFEKRLGDGPGWLQFGPAVYYSLEEDYNSPYGYYDANRYYYDEEFGFFREPYSKMRGGGLDVNYKRFINPARSFYLAAGLSYTYFNIKYWGMAWTDYTEDGLEYHEYKPDYLTQHINRLGVNTYFGYQIPTRKAFLFDMFVGMAYRHSISNKNKQSFDNYMISYGYTGFVFLTGIRIGFGIR